MNYIRHLTGFFDKIQEDNRLNPTHISLYLALFQFWNLNHFQNPISISRNEMMKLSKIAAFGTYHKCIKDLQEFGYIEYFPSFNPYKGSLVNLFKFDDIEVQNIDNYHIKNSTSSIQEPNHHHIKNCTSSKQELNHHHIKIDTSFRQALEPSINYINLLNNKHIVTSPDTSSIFKQALLPLVSHPQIIPKSVTSKSEKKEKLRQKKKENLEALPPTIELPQPPNKNWDIPGENIPPSSQEVKFFFEEKNAPLIEAQKFYDHYEANGWLVGGKSKMKNWHAAARNWLLNTKKFNEQHLPTPQSSNRPKPNNLQATTNKNYKEPL